MQKGGGRRGQRRVAAREREGEEAGRRRDRRDTWREEARWRMRKKLCKTPVSYLLRCIKFPVRVPVLYKIMLMSRGPLRMAACWS